MTEPVRERQMSFLAAAGWALLVGAMTQLVLGVTDALHPGAMTNLVSIAASALLAHAVVLFAILRVYGPDVSIREALALRWPRAAFVPLALAFGLGIAPAVARINEALELRFPPSGDEAAFLDKVFAANTLGERVSLAVALVLVLPACEELFFRGLLFTSLAKHHPVGKVVVATTAYSVLLGGAGPRVAGPLLVVALSFGLVRRLSGSALPSLLASVAFFGVSVVPSALARPDLHFGLPVVAAGLAGCVVSFGCMVALSRRDLREAPSRASRPSVK